MTNTGGKFCKALKTDGKPCKAPPTKNGLCYFHANPDQARVLGQKGGRKNRYQVTDVVVPERITGAALGTVLDRTLGELLAGRLDPRVATAVAQLVNMRRRVTETVDLETRVSELERKLADQGNTAADKAGVAADDSDLPLWWMRNENEKGDGDGSGNNGNA
jgi:uncharacterized protein DUF5763